MTDVTITISPSVDADFRNAILEEFSDIGDLSVVLNDTASTIGLSALQLLSILRRHTAVHQRLSGQSGAPPADAQPQRDSSTFPSSSSTSFYHSFKPIIFSKYSLSFPSPIVFNHNAVMNIAGEFIPDELLLVASLGRKFVPPIHFDRDRILLDLSKLENRAKLERGIDGNLLREATSLIKTHVPKPPGDLQKHVKHIFYVAERFLSDNPSVCVSPADKGNISVIYNKYFYEERMRHHLDSSGVYQKIGAPSHIGLIRRNHALLNRLSDIGFLGERLVAKIAAQETQIPMLYGVWKPFKDFSIRPILSSVNVVGGKLFEVLVDILNRLDKDNGYSLTNTTQLIKEIKQLILKPDDMIFSIDVVSMFTNIQPDLAFSVIFPKLPSITNLNPVLFREIFMFVTKMATEFGCMGGTYKQISGLPMGTKGSPVIASIVLTHFFNTILPKHSPVTYLRKYVDDTILITSRENAMAILSSLNEIDPRIKFTIEEESECSINFLDVTLIRRTPKIVTKWFCKPFSSNRLVNWYSEHEPHTISNTAVRYISNMLFYSDLTFHSEMTDRAKVILFKNSFPSSVIEDYLIKAKEIVAFNIFGENEAENTKFFSTLAPIPVLRSLNRLCISNKSNVKYVNTYSEDSSASTIFSHLKDPQSFEHLNNVVVRVTCKSCKFFRIIPITTPLILYKALKLSRLLHPFSFIEQHLSDAGHIGFSTKVIRSCGSTSMTFHVAKLLCKKNGISCPT